MTAGNPAYQPTASSTYPRKTYQAGAAALQTGMPVFRQTHRPRWLSAPDIMVVAEHKFKVSGLAALVKAALERTQASAGRDDEGSRVVEPTVEKA